MKISKGKEHFELEITPDELKLVLEIIISNKEAYNFFMQYVAAKLMIKSMVQPGQYPHFDRVE